MGEEVAASVAVDLKSWDVMLAVVRIVVGSEVVVDAPFGPSAGSRNTLLLPCCTMC